LQYRQSQNKTEKQTELQKLQEEISNPVVDLNFFYDVVRTAMNLGIAYAIGWVLITVAPESQKNFISGGLILILVSVLFVIKSIQIWAAAFKLCGVERKGFPKTLGKWVGAVSGVVIGLVLYVCLTVIVGANLAVVFKNIQNNQKA
jgi:hypothetical protein